MPRKTITALTLSCLLIVAIGLVVYGQTRQVEPTFHGKLADLLPPAPPGWIRSEQPIADTPEMRQKVDELLSFDDGVFYIYTSGELRLSVYAAYWQPGKMSSRLVAGHTPDICWVSAGWKCTERGEITPALPPPSTSISPAPTPLPPAQSRIFNAHGQTEHVWFWHMVDGESNSYSLTGKIPWHALLSDMIEDGLNLRSEQFFIRISSPTPIDSPALRPVLDAVLRAMPLSNPSS